jgi:hypothetical protein
MRKWLESYWKEHASEERLEAFQNWDDEFFSFIDCEQWKDLPDTERWDVKEKVKSWLEDLMRKLGDFGFDPNHLVPGNIIVMWDGKSFGFYPDLDSAIQDAIDRITDRRNCFSPPEDFECLEFLEVVDETQHPSVRPPLPGCLRDYTLVLGKGCRNENGTRLSFDYPVKDLGNQLEKFTCQ